MDVKEITKALLSGEDVLTLRGRIPHYEGESIADFDRSDLDITGNPKICPHCGIPVVERTYTEVIKAVFDSKQNAKENIEQFKNLVRELQGTAAQDFVLIYLPRKNNGKNNS